MDRSGGFIQSSCGIRSSGEDVSSSCESGREEVVTVLGDLCCVGAETVGGNGVGSAAAVLENIWLDLVGCQGSWGSRPERVGAARQKTSTTVKSDGQEIDLENVYDVA
jgi:hypothetical protein